MFTNIKLYAFYAPTTLPNLGTAQQLYYEQEGIDRGLKVWWPTSSEYLKKLKLRSVYY